MFTHIKHALALTLGLLSAQHVLAASAMQALAATSPTARLVENSRSTLCPTQPPLQSNASAAEEYAAARLELQCRKSMLLAAPLLAINAGASSNAVAEITQTASSDVDETKDKVKETGANSKFLGFNWGLGIGYELGLGPTRVGDAEVVNNIVRVKEDATDGVRAVLEAHHFFEVSRGKIGIGPVAAVQLGSDGSSAVSFALGAMIGWKDQDDKTSAGSWNLGIAYDLSQGVKVLGDGITANKPLPAGETQIRYKTQSAGGLLVFFSRRFRMEPLE
jgi:hypothetical protein